MRTAYPAASQPKRAVPIVTAAQAQPTLARMLAVQQHSEALWASAAPQMPAPLRTSIRAATLDETSWCLLAPTSALAAKLRQMQPVLIAHAHAQGHAIKQLRIKVAAAER